LGEVYILNCPETRWRQVKDRL